MPPNDPLPGAIGLRSAKTIILGAALMAARDVSSRLMEQGVGRDALLDALSPLARFVEGELVPMPDPSDQPPSSL
jgi:hypothetical protein